MDFSQHRAWQYANYRHDLLVEGLPVDDKEKDDRDRSLAELVGDPKEPGQTLKELFPQGEKVNTQVMEVERVKRVLTSEVEKASSDRTKQLSQLARYLKPLATSFPERERLMLIQVNLADDDKAKALKTALQQGFQPALAMMKQEKDLPDMDAKGVRPKRPFEQLYRETIQQQGVYPRGPFVDQLLSILPRQGGKSYAEAFAGLGDMPNEEAFLRAVRNEPGKSFQEIFDAAYDEMVGKLVADLHQRLFDDHFAEALKGQRRAVAGNTSSQQSAYQQRSAIARLLFNLVEVMPSTSGQQAPKFWDDPGYKRVINVVGLQMLGLAIDRQANLYQSMINDLNTAVAKEHNNFAAEHQALLEQIKDQANEVERLAALVQRTKAMADDKENIVAQRRVDIDYYMTELDKVRKDSAAQKDVLRKMSDELFKITVQVRDAARINEQYEKQLNTLEDRVR
jgi:hypothetical protein